MAKGVITIKFSELQSLINGTGINDLFLVNPGFALSVDSETNHVNYMLVFMKDSKSYGVNYSLDGNGKLSKIDGVGDVNTVLSLIDEEDLDWLIACKEVMFAPVVRYMYLPKEEAMNFMKLEKDCIDALKSYKERKERLTV